MVELAVAGNERFEVSTVELDRGGVSYTVDTLEELTREDSHDLFLVVGSDGLAAFESWYRPRRILELATLVVYPRQGYEAESRQSSFFDKAVNLDTPIIEVSSSTLRARLGEGKTARYLIPEPVLRYIESNGLYV